MDTYDTNRINRAMIVLEEAMKGVYAAHALTDTGLRPVRAARDRIADMAKQQYKIELATEKEHGNA